MIGLSSIRARARIFRGLLRAVHRLALQSGGWVSITRILILLRHRNGWVPVILRGALQQGHRARVVARATIRCQRIVAIELASWPPAISSDRQILTCEH